MPMSCIMAVRCSSGKFLARHLSDAAWMSSMRMWPLVCRHHFDLLAGDCLPSQLEELLKFADCHRDEMDLLVVLVREHQIDAVVLVRVLRPPHAHVVVVDGLALVCTR